jgi:succinate dehydrogenase / fumarate reductase, membrane anchor subunit
MRRGLGLATLIMSLRSPLSRVLGLGSAKDGTAHWWAQRVTAIALIPLTLWLVLSLLTLPDLDYETVRTWLSVPISGFLAVLTVGVLTYHSYLGTQVIIEDYVAAAGTKVLLLLLLRFLYVLCGGAAIFAILRVAFGLGFSGS